MPKKRTTALDRLFFLTAAEATVLSFIVVSLIGGLLLWMTEHHRLVHARIPIIHSVNLNPVEPIPVGLYQGPMPELHTFTQETTYYGEHFIDSLFTAVSALCVTGLTSTDFSQFTLEGQIITLILIQMGGLGIIVFTSLFAMAIMRGIPEGRNFRTLLASIIDTESKHIGRMLKHIFIYTFVFEAIATLIMGIHLQWFANPLLLHGINPWWWALFHAISAFNNAGFGLLNNNLVNFVTDPVINIVIAALIILGGLGYPVLITIHVAVRSLLRRKQSQASEAHHVMASNVQLLVAIIGTILLLAAGTLLPLILDWNNPALAPYSPTQKILITFFQSTSTRTAGFNTVDIGILSSATLWIYILLMFIGANPGGTAGGVKIPTVAVLYGYLKDWFQEPGLPVVLFKHRISKFAVSHAIRLFFFSILFLGIMNLLILIAEYPYIHTPDSTFNFFKVIFELFSAFGTVGLSMGYPGGVTSFSAILNPFSKSLIIITMLFGRLGPLTVLAALRWKRRRATDVSPDFKRVDKIQIG